MKEKEKRRIRRKKQSVGAKEPGDLIPMPDFQREFLKLRGKHVYNPEMEIIMLTDPPSDRRLTFGTAPLPWEKPLTQQEIKHLQAAQQRKFVCKNSSCDSFEKEVTGHYQVVKFKHTIPHSNTGNKELDLAQNLIDNKRFGKRERVFFHTEVLCPRCKRHIQFVKHNMANRRAAKDLYVSGPHQYRR